MVLGSAALTRSTELVLLRKVIIMSSISSWELRYSWMHGVKTHNPSFRWLVFDVNVQLGLLG